MEKHLSTEESFEIIQKMIGSAKDTVRKKDSFFFLYWGYIISISSLVSYIGHITKQYYLTYIWFLPILAVPYSVYKGIQINKTQFVKTYINDVIAALWTAFGISMLVFVAVVLIIFEEYIHLICPVSLLMISIGIFTTGKAFSFKPLIIGAIICWAGAVLCFIFKNQGQYLIYPIALFFGYILPGHLIRNKAHV